MNIISNEKEAIQKLIQQFAEESLIPVFGAGFSAGAEALKGTVPDAKKANEMMQKTIVQCVDFITEEELKTEVFANTAKLFNQLNSKELLQGHYKTFLRNNFTEVKLEGIKRDFLNIAWPYALTLNVDDAIERTGAFETILPYLDADNQNRNSKVLYKLHGDAMFECKYSRIKSTIIFDMDQYIKSINDEHNQSFRECIYNTYRDFNMLFIGCSLSNEPDLKYFYNQIKTNEKNVARYVVRKKLPNTLEQISLEDYGITDIIVVKDYDEFYMNFLTEYNKMSVETRIEAFPFKNPKTIEVKDKDLKYFSGYNMFNEKANCFNRSILFIERECIKVLQEKIEHNDVVMLVGRRFSGKTTILSFLCNYEIKRTVYFFPSTVLESPDVIQRLLCHTRNCLFVFDTNSLSVNSYFLIRDGEDIIKQNNSKIIIAVNQSDNYLSEEIECDEVHIKNYFSDNELKLFKMQSDSFGFIERDLHSTNLDYLEKLYKEQKVPVLTTLQLPNSYTPSEKVLLILLCVKDKIYTKEIYSLRISQKELEFFLNRTAKLVEFVRTSKGENSSCKSTRKLVHNSKMILLREIQGFQHRETIDVIIRIVKCFLRGDNDQKRIYKEVMQFDTLNQLFGKRRGAGQLIFQVYQELQPILKEDLHYWLQRAKSIYRLVDDTQYCKLKEAYGYAKKVYMDSKQKSLTAKAALSTSLVCCLLYRIERNTEDRLEYQREAIRLGEEAIQSEYYRSDMRLNSELDSKGYRIRLLETCKDYIISTNTDKVLYHKALEIVNKFR